MKWLPLLALTACLTPASVPCGDGDLCPPGTECRAVSNPDQKLCASADQIAQCDGKPDYTKCLANGRCYAGVCLTITCGNGRVDRADPNDPMDQGENCDDRNQTSGDGCSADCLSNETCGNGFLDPIKTELCDDGNHVGHDGCDNACGPEQARWTKLTFGPPTARKGYGLAYDAARRKVVLFGGADPTTGELFDDTWEWDGVGWQRIETSGAPTPREDVAMAYDAARRVTVLYGGGRGDPDGYSSETWLWDGTLWTPVATIDSPGRRAAFGMAYDSARERIVLFGGFVDTGNKIGTSNETWEWDGTNWSRKMTATTPDITSDGSLAYDPMRTVMVAFGGAGTLNNYVWEYDGVNWHSTAPSGTWPAQRIDAALAWDPTLNKIVLFGGSVTGTDSAQTYAWNGQTWSLLAPVSSPGARSAMVAVTDSVRARIVTWGGTASSDPDTWEWNGSQWLDMPMQTLAPQSSPAAYDSLHGRTVLVDRANPAEVWEFNGHAWAKIATTSSKPNLGPARSMAYDEAHHQIVLFGGTYNDPTTWLWDGAVWTTVAAGPTARSNAAMAYDASRDKVVLFGGSNGALLADTWEWNGSAWSLIAPASSPPPLQGAAMGYDPVRKQVVLFGGTNDVGDLVADTWTFDGTTWSHMTVATSPANRTAPSIAWYAARHHLVMFGGRKGMSWLNDTWEWTGTTWQLIPIAVAPTDRGGAALFPLPDGGVGMFGGAFGISLGFTQLDDTWRLRWEDDVLEDTCHDQVDVDGDQLKGCADGDCSLVCAGCGDGVCTRELEDCRICPTDCICKDRCGDFYCDAPETHTTCPGDCP